ncbi:MAG: signal peptidase I [Clostridiales bacterium]|nr:signal peptidase I [Clostridiales bacterium]
MNENSKKKSTKEAWEWFQAILVALVLALLIRTFIFEIIIVDGDSMLPTLKDKDRVFVNKLIYFVSEPKLGDMIIFKTPEDNKTNYVKRIIGLSGDKVRIEKGIVYLNDKPLDEPYVLELPSYDFPEVTVPKDCFFVLGDNRNGSKDSRDPYVGFVPQENLVGKAIWRIWPLDQISVLE